MMMVESPAIMPESVVQVSARVDLRSEAPLSALAPGIRLPRRLRTAARSRQIEYLLGRACAAQAIAQLDAGLGHWVPRVLRSGAPGFPPGITGSISHAGGFVTAAAARLSAVEAIGIDVETIADSRRASRVARRVATRLEIKAVMDAVQVDRETAVTLLFSAKEALFKALYPLVRRRFDFLDARVWATGDGSSGQLCARLLVTLGPRAPQDTALAGRFEVRDGCVHTGIVMPARLRRACDRIRSSATGPSGRTWVHRHPGA